MVQNKNFLAKSSYSAPLLFHAVAAGAAARAAAARAAAGAAASAAVCIYDVVIGGRFAPPYMYMIKYIQQKQQKQQQLQQHLQQELQQQLQQQQHPRKVSSHVFT